jgi:hypothetical protein
MPCQAMLFSGVCRLWLPESTANSELAQSTVNDMIYIANVRYVFIKILHQTVH